MRPIPPILLLLAASAGAACTDDAPPDEPDAGPPCGFELAWGRPVDGVFTPYADGDEAGVVLGFQGFRFIDSSARLGQIDAPSAVFRFQVEVDGQAPMTQDAAAELVPGADGARYADHLQIFFNDIAMPELLGRSAAVRARATAAGCTAADAATVTLVNGGCQDASGGTSCGDAGL